MTDEPLESAERLALATVADTLAPAAKSNADANAASPTASALARSALPVAASASPSPSTTSARNEAPRILPHALLHCFHPHVVAFFPYGRRRRPRACSGAAQASLACSAWICA